MKKYLKLAAMMPFLCFLSILLLSLSILHFIFGVLIFLATYPVELIENRSNLKEDRCELVEILISSYMKILEDIFIINNKR